MALRVLLADESSTIKRVIQLSLQDFAVEVKSVNLGVDVVEVAKKFQPDIIFADILLQKRNGYEVSQDIKADPELSRVPTILMWSGFIDLDEQKYLESGADDRLEKPFDAETLRNLVRRYVPKTAQQSLSNFLNFPKIEVAHEKPPLAAPVAGAPPETRSSPATLGASDRQVKNPGHPSPPTAEPRATTSMSAATQDIEKPNWSMDSFADLPDLQDILSPIDALDAPLSDDIGDDLDAKVEPELAELNDFDSPSAPPDFTKKSAAANSPTFAEGFKSAKPGAVHRAPADMDLRLEGEDEGDEDEDQDAWSRQDISQFRLEDPVAEDHMMVHYDHEEGPVDERDLLVIQHKRQSSASAENRQDNMEPSPMIDSLSRVDAHSTLARSGSPGPGDNTISSELVGGLEDFDLPYEPSLAEPNEENGDLVLMQTPTRSASIYGDAGQTNQTNQAKQMPEEALDKHQIEQIIRQQSQTIIENIARSVVPAVAERLIREELNRLLTEKEAQP